MKRSAPGTYGLWEDGQLVAECHFEVAGDALVILRIDRHRALDGDIHDMLLRAVTSYAMASCPTRVICRNPDLFAPLTALRFVAVEDRVESTPEEVLRHLCPGQ